MVHVDEVHACKNSPISENVECFDFVKKFIRNLSDLEHVTVLQIYERCMYYALSEYDSNYIIQFWPDRARLLLFIRRFRQQIRPPFADINLANKHEYEIDQKISQFEGQNIMESLENNDFLILYFEKSIKFLGEGKNVCISIDGTLWNYMQPTWCQLLVVACTVRMENGNYLDIPVSLIFMSNKLKESYKKIIIKLNYLLQKLTGMRLGTEVFCTDSE